MKRLKTFSLIVALGLSISLTTHAQTRVDRWSGNGAFTGGYAESGDSWNSPNQPGFDRTAGGILYTDADVLGSTNNSSSHTGATLFADGVSEAPSPFGPPGGLGEGVFYTFMAVDPAMTITSNGVLDDVGYIYLTISSSVGSFTSGSVSLNFDGDFELIDFVPKAGALVPTPIGPKTLYQATWAWEVEAGVAPDDFTLSWITPIEHAAYFDVSLTQSVEAIPEPSTWALLGAGLFAALWMNRRRKASLSVGR